MQIDPPIWSLRRQRCPCPCGGEGRLEFHSCPSCLRVVLVCNEVGTTYPDPASLSFSSPDSSFDLHSHSCPGCHRVPLSSFVPASSEQIRALGFAVSDYE